MSLTFPSCKKLLEISISCKEKDSLSQPPFCNPFEKERPTLCGALFLQCFVRCFQIFCVDDGECRPKVEIFCLCPFFFSKMRCQLFLPAEAPYIAAYSIQKAPIFTFQVLKLLCISWNFRWKSPAQYCWANAVKGWVRKGTCSSCGINLKMPWLWSTAAASGTNVALTKHPSFVLGHWLGHLQWQGCFHSLAPVSSSSFQICVWSEAVVHPTVHFPRQPRSASTNQRWSARSDPSPEYGHLLCSKQTLHFCETPVCPSDQGLCTRVLAGRGWLGLAASSPLHRPAALP